MTEEQKGNSLLTNNADEIAALATIGIGGLVAGYMLVTGMEINETAVGVLTMMVGTPLGYLFGKA